MNVEEYYPMIESAVQLFWRTRLNQTQNQVQRDVADTGNRGAVTGGRQLDGFLHLLIQVAIDIGIPEVCIYRRGNHIPGYFRPTKDWDLLIITPNNKLVAVIELKSQVGSFGNNFNNRTEEAIGSALDFWTAFRENYYPNQVAPWVGYLMLVESCQKSNSPVRVKEPHYQVSREFIDASYIDRYKILCQKLMRERHYNQCCLITSNQDETFNSVPDEISIETFLSSFIGYLISRTREFE